MGILIIGGKEYEYEITWGAFEKSCKRREGSKKDNTSLLIDDVFLYLKGRPFLTKRKLKNTMKLSEFSIIDKQIGKEISEILEDREGGNSQD